MATESSRSLKLLLTAVIFALCGCGGRRAVVFEIPQGYVGWIRVKCKVAGAAPLPIRNSSYIARIPANGLLKTSTVEEDGWGADEFYYVTKSGQKIRLLSDSLNQNTVVWGDAGRTNERWMFIGTKKQW